MAEVLSQSQIDALLNAARSGELDVDKPGEKRHGIILPVLVVQCVLQVSAADNQLHPAVLGPVGRSVL